MADTWNIRGRSETCSRCERHFEPGTNCHSRLVRGEERFERRDFCAACSEAPDDGPSPVSRWRSVVEAPTPPAPEPIHRRSAEALLRRLGDDPSREAANTRFILALMLERKRVLRCRDRFRDESRAYVFVYEHPQTGETFLVPDPGLSPQQASQVHEQLALFLQDEPHDAAGEIPAAASDPPANASELPAAADGDTARQRSRDAESSTNEAHPGTEEHAGVSS